MVGVVRDREPNLKKVALSWSSGKDSAWTLHLLRQRPDIQVVALITTFNSEADRVAMHAVRRALVEAQASEPDCHSGQSSCPGRAPTRNTKIGCAPCASVRSLRELRRSHSETCFFRMFEITGYGNCKGPGLSRYFPSGKFLQTNCPAK